MSHNLIFNKSRLKLWNSIKGPKFNIYKYIGRVDTEDDTKGYVIKCIAYMRKGKYAGSYISDIYHESINVDILIREAVRWYKELDAKRYPELIRLINEKY